MSDPRFNFNAQRGPAFDQHVSKGPELEGILLKPVDSVKVKNGFPGKMYVPYDFGTYE